MGEVIRFPAPAKRPALPAGAIHRDDPYYHFIRSVLSTADACGFSMPYGLDSAVEHVYLKTRNSSELARLLRNAH